MVKPFHSLKETKKAGSSQMGFINRCRAQLARHFSCCIYAFLLGVSNGTRQSKEIEKRNKEGGDEGRAQA
jgi:hypothetical protein